MKRIYILLMILAFTPLYGQQTIDQIQKQFDELSKTQPGLLEKVEVSISGVPLSNFITTIALEHNLNVNVDDKLSQVVIVSNYYDAIVKDVFVFLIKQYHLNVEFTGSIISFKTASVKPTEKPKYTPKIIDVKYRPDNTFLSLNLKNDSLQRVAEAITKASGNNIILAPNIKDKLVSVYIENRPFENAIELMCKSNGLEMLSNGDGVFFIKKQVNVNTNNNKPTAGRNNNNTNSKNNKPSGLNIKLNENDKLNVEAFNVSINDLIVQASDLMGEHYFMYDVPEGNTSLFIENIGYEDLLINILKGTDYTFKKSDHYFVIGNRNTEGLRTFELIQLDNRSVETVFDLIPSDLTANLELKEFIELNGFMVTGSYVQIQELRRFLKAIDVVVPMVQIDVIIVLSGKSVKLSTGIKAGISDSPVQTSGDIFPGLDVTAGAQTINGLINAFNGFGIINLGAVTPNFYLSLKALESNNIIDMTSTPKISTLNGHEATLVVGETDYYEQVQTTFTNTINGGNIGQSRVFVPTEANLSITVKPFVSADEYVTLEINVEQSDFKAKSDPSAPPGKSTQSFKSLIRVKNGEMILMGGLEKKKKADSGSGTPFLSRIPIIKWFFSSREKEKDKSKLHIFIKPTVTY